MEQIGLRQETFSDGDEQQFTVEPHVPNECQLLVGDFADVVQHDHPRQTCGQFFPKKDVFCIHHPGVSIPPRTAPVGNKLVD